MIRLAFISTLLASGFALASFSLPAWAQTPTKGPTLRTGGSGDQIRVSEAYQADIFARRLGHISALTRHADGTLYVADRDGGRLFRIQDRAMDGAADITQALPHRFDRPTGLAVMGDRLFVADRSGLWGINPGAGTPTLIAPFANSGSTGEPHPIIALGDGRLLLGLNRTDGQTRLLDIDVMTGAATLRDEIRGQITGFASEATDEATGEAITRSDPWIIFARAGDTWFGQTFVSARPIGDDVQAVLVDTSRAEAMIAASDGIRRTVATFAGLRDGGDLLIRVPDREVAFGPMLSDARGLFAADPASGRIWRIRAAATVVADDMAADPDSDETDDAPTDLPDPVTDQSVRPALPRGSAISRASRIDAASTLPEAQAPSTNPSQPASDDPSRR